MHFTTDTCIMTDNYLSGAHAGLIVASVNDRLVPPEMAVMSDMVASNDRYVIGFRLRPGVVPDDFDFTVSPIIN